MRLWTIHPAQLDRRALVAGWREGLLAQKVLAGGTRGYRHHPQLERFRAAPDEMAAVTTYLWGLVDEADARGYRFDRAKVLRPASGVRLPVTRGQVEYEWQHLRAKVQARDPQWFHRCLESAQPRVHPMFDLVDGPVEPWEVVGDQRRPATPQS